MFLYIVASAYSVHYLYLFAKSTIQIIKKLHSFQRHIHHAISLAHLVSENAKLMMSSKPNEPIIMSDNSTQTDNVAIKLNICENTEISNSSITSIVKSSNVEGFQSNEYIFIGEQSNNVYEMNNNTSNIDSIDINGEWVDMPDLAHNETNVGSALAECSPEIDIPNTVVGELNVNCDELPPELEEIPVSRIEDEDNGNGEDAEEEIENATDTTVNSDLFELEDEIILYEIENREATFLDSEKEDNTYYLGLFYISNDPQDVGQALFMLMAIQIPTFLHYSYYDIENYISDFSICSSSENLEIMKTQVSYYEDVFSVRHRIVRVILKTHWLRLVQRHWKKTFQLRKQAIHKRMSLYVQLHFMLHGCYPEGYKHIPTLRGMLNMYSK